MLRCKECKYYQQSCRNFVETNFTEGRGDTDTDVMVVFDSPFAQDVQADSIANDQKYNKALDRFLQTIGLDIHSVYLTTLIKCFISDKKNKPTKKMKEKCVGLYLSEEIKKVQPKVIFVCGRMATQWFIPDVNHRVPLKQVIGQTFYSTEYDAHVVPIYDMYYLAKFSDNSPQAKLTNQAFAKAKVLLEGETKDKPKIEYSSDIKDLKDLGTYVACDLETTGLDPHEAKVITIALTDVKTGKTVSFDAENYLGITKCKHCNGSGKVMNTAKSEAIADASTDKQMEKAESMDDEIDCPECSGCGKAVSPVIEKTKFYTEVIPACIKAIKKRKLVYHNALFDLQMFLGAGYDVTDSLIADTRLMQFLINPMGANSLGFLVQLYYGVAYKDEIDRANLVAMDMESRRYYCAEDTYYTGKLFVDLGRKIKDQDSLKSNHVLTNMIKVLTFLEFRGIKVDPDKVDEIIGEYEKERDKYVEKFKKKFKLPEEFNLNSPQQLSKLLYEGLKLPVLGRTKTKNKETGEYNPSTAKDVLKKLASKRPALKTLTAYRTIKGHIEKLKGYKKAIGSDGRVHSSFNLFSPDSSRLMSSKPNIQNVPRESRIKEIFVAEEGYSYVYYDYSQIEFRVLLHLAKDKRGLEFVNKGKDIHAYIASQFYREPYEMFAEKKTPEHVEKRNRVKTIVYGTMYGRTPEGIVKEHGGSVEDAEGIQRIFFNVCREGYFWLKQIEQTVFNKKKLRTPFGTYRFFPDVDMITDPYKRDKVTKEAKSFIIQSWAVELVFLGMWKTHKAIRDKIQKKNLDACFIHQIHDCGILEVKDEHLEAVKKIVWESAETPYKDLLLPLEIEMKVGKTWDEVA